MKLITLDEVYDLYIKRNPCGFYMVSAKDIGTPFVVYCEHTKRRGYKII